MKWESILTVHNIKTSPVEVVKKLDAATENDLYHATLLVQNELHVAENTRYLSGNPKWRSAKSVLDLGCGPGDLVAHLSRHFADKFFVGVDINEEFIAMAKKQTWSSTNCRFFNADLYEFAQGRYDFVILRAVLQHLKDPDRFMKHLPNVLQDQAAVLFLETTKENFVEAHPPITTFDDFYRRAETIQKNHTGSRDCIAELTGQLGKYHFKLIEEQKLLLPVRDARNRARIVQYLILGCAISRKMLPIPIKMSDLFADLIHWHDAKDSRLNLKSLQILIEME